MSQNQPLYWDNFNPEVWKDPYPTFRRLRNEAPLYYNDVHDFYAVSRYDDVQSALMDRETFSSARGDILEIIKSGIDAPPAMFILQDPPVHTAYRNVLQRAFTPRRVSELEQKVRELCAHHLDQHVGTGQLDFVLDLGTQVPMRVIGMLLGIPEQDLEAVRQRGEDFLATEAGKPMDFDASDLSGDAFADYVEWRTTHPSDDLMTELLNVEFRDPEGRVRRLHRDEILSMVGMLAAAGNETTNRLIGWAGKVLAEHPDQRRDLVRDPSLVAQTIEELLRFEPTGPAVARYVTRDVTFHGQTVPAGSALMLILASANRDERRFQNPEVFDLHRERIPHLTFGTGIHMCIGSPLARLEARVALEEVLKRFPEWEVDYENAKLSSTSTVRGWETLPTFTEPGKRPAPRAKVTAAPVVATPAAPVSLEGRWSVTLKSPTGPVTTVLELQHRDDKLTGTQSGQGTTSPMLDAKFDGHNVSWINEVTKPMKLKVEFTGTVDGVKMSGKAKAGFMGSYPFTAIKQ